MRVTIHQTLIIEVYGKTITGLGPHTDVWRDLNKADRGAVPQFSFPESLNQFTLVSACIVINKAHNSKIGCMFVFVMFLCVFCFVFESTFFL